MYLLANILVQLENASFLISTGIQLNEKGKDKEKFIIFSILIITR